jgi:DNA-binding beta-propeller fold protein YncE
VSARFSNQSQWAKPVHGWLIFEPHARSEKRKGTKMKTRRPVHPTRTLAFCATAALMLATGAQSQNLFVSDSHDNAIYEFTPGGLKTTFASGLDNPQGLAFDRAGNLYEADSLSSTVYKFKPNGARTIFAGGLYEPSGSHGHSGQTGVRPGSDRNGR